MRLKSIVRSLRARTVRQRWRYSWQVGQFNLAQFIACSTPRKVLNWMNVNAQKWLKRDHLWGMPFRYTIDPSNVCNLRCPLCPTGLGLLGRDRGRIAFDQYRRVIDQIASYAYLVELYDWGEPYLHPHIFEIIQYASERRIMVRLSTNLNHFNAEMAAQTVKSGLGAINVSVDGVTQESYEKYRRGGDLAKVLHNIALLIEAKRAAKSKLPFVTLRMLANRYNEGDIEQMRALAARLKVDAINIAPIFVDTQNPAQVQEWLPANDALSSYNYALPTLENVWTCADLWESMVINWDGGVSPCCWIHKRDYDFANAFDLPLKDIWNNEAFVASRRAFASGSHRPSATRTICTICKGRPRYLKD